MAAAAGDGRGVAAQPDAKRAERDARDTTEPAALDRDHPLCSTFRPSTPRSGARAASSAAEADGAVLAALAAGGIRATAAPLELGAGTQEDVPERESRDDLGRGGPGFPALSEEPAELVGATSRRRPRLIDRIKPADRRGQVDNEDGTNLVLNDMKRTAGTEDHLLPVFAGAVEPVRRSQRASSPGRLRRDCEESSPTRDVESRRKRLLSLQGDSHISSRTDAPRTTRNRVLLPRQETVDNADAGAGSLGDDRPVHDSSDNSDAGKENSPFSDEDVESLRNSVSPEPALTDMIKEMAVSANETREGDGGSVSGSDEDGVIDCGSKRASELGSDSDINTAALATRKRPRKKKPKPTKLKSASKKVLEEMHKESQRLVRAQDISINARVIKKLDMSSFLQKFSSRQRPMPLAPTGSSRPSSDASPAIRRAVNLPPSSPPPHRVDKRKADDRQPASPSEGRSRGSPPRLVDKGKERGKQTPAPSPQPSPERPPRQKLDKGKGKAPPEPSPVRNPPGNVPRSGHAPVAQYIVARREQLESGARHHFPADGSDSDLEIIGAPGAPDPNANLPEAKRILANRPCSSTGGSILPQPVRAAMSAKKRYHELAGVKSPPSTNRRKRMPSSAGALPPSPWDSPGAAGGIKILNASLREKIAEQAAERRRRQEEQAKAAGLWRPARVELVDADVPREAAMPRRRDEDDEEQDEDYVSGHSGTDNSDIGTSGTDQDDTASCSGSDVNEDDGELSGPSEDSSSGEDRYGHSGGEEDSRLSGSDESADVHASLAVGEESQDEVLPVVRRKTKADPHARGPIQPDAGLADKAPAIAAEDDPRATSPRPASAGFGALFAPSNEPPARKLSPGAFAGLFAPSNELAARDSQAWDRLRRAGPFGAPQVSPLPDGNNFANSPDSPAVAPAAGGASSACELLANEIIVEDSQPQQSTWTETSQYLDSQGLLVRREAQGGAGLPAEGAAATKSGREGTAVKSNKSAAADKSESPGSVFQNRNSPRRGYDAEHAADRTADVRSDAEDDGDFDGTDGGGEEAPEGEEDDECPGDDDVSDTVHDSARRRRRNEFVDEEAEEEEDDFMGFGGRDGDASDDDGEDLTDMIEKRKISASELKADKVRNLHRKQIAEQDQRAVEQLIKDLDGGGGLLRKRRGLGDALGFGLESDSDEDEDWRSARRRPGKRGRHHDGDDPLLADERTASFARAQKGPHDEYDDPFASEDEEARLSAYGKSQSAALENANVLRDSVASAENSTAGEPFSPRAFAEEELDIETQNSEILSIINDRSAAARSRRQQNASPQRPRRRLLGASPSKLRMIRNLHNDESQGGASSFPGGHIGGFVRSETAVARAVNRRTVVFRRAHAADPADPARRREAAAGTAAKGKSGAEEASPKGSSAGSDPRAARAAAGPRSRSGLLKLLERTGNEDGVQAGRGH